MAKIKNAVLKEGWLKERFGDNVAQISTENTLKLKGAIRDVARMLDGHVSSDIHRLASALPNPPQGISDKEYLFGYESSEGRVEGVVNTDPVLKEYISKYPKHWEIVQSCCGLARSRGRHAAAYIIGNKPIHEFIPMTTVGGYRVTQYSKDQVESAGGLKMDFLVVTALQDINNAVRLVQDRHAPEIDWSPGRNPSGTPPFMDLNGTKVPYIRCVPFKGKFYDIWELPEDQDVYDMICKGDTDSVFQLGTPSAKGWLKHFNVLRSDGSGRKGLASIEDLAAFTALDRPGPLDAFVTNPDGTQHNMLVEFANRALYGIGVDRIEVLDRLLPETYGVICYQEGLTKVFREIGGADGIQAENFRKHIGKKQMSKVIEDRKIFMAGAVPRVGKETAERIWSNLETFGSYGFCQAHAVAYVIVAYATAFLKHHYPLEWWTAVLNGADRNKINQKLWSYCGKYIDFPDIASSGARFEIVNNRIKSPLWLLMGVGDKAQEQIAKMGPPKDIRDFLEKEIKWKEENSTVTETVVDDETTGQKVVKKAVKKGRSAITSKVLNALIASGSMDSLFPLREYPTEAGIQKMPMNLAEKMAFVEDIKRELSGKKTKKLPQIQVFNDLEVFIFKKKLLPHFSQSLYGICLPMIKNRIQNDKSGGLRFHYPVPGTDTYKDYTLATGNGLSALVESGVVSMMDRELRYGLIAYVLDDKRLPYKDKKTGKTKTRVVLTIEAEGATFEAVMWPTIGGFPPNVSKQNLKDAVVVACLHLRNPQKPTLEAVHVISTSKELEESKEESK